MLRYGRALKPVATLFIPTFLPVAGRRSIEAQPTITPGGAAPTPRRDITVSVNIEELTAHLDSRRQADVKEQYDARATNATTAFLLCFFLGYIGAHRYYLKQWRSGVAHLVLFALGAAGVVVGFLTAAPLNAALFVIGGLLILASLIWEVIDLGRIDDEIHRRNLLLAEGLIAGALLSDTSVVDEAAHKLDEVVHTAATQSQAAGYQPAAATAGAISLNDLAQAREIAQQSGRAAISYDAVTTFDVSAAPGERPGDHPALEPETTTERRVNTQPLPTPQDAEAPIETETLTHTVDAYQVTDAQETDRVSGPSAAEALGLGAAALDAAGLGFGLAEAAHAEPQPASIPDAVDQETGPLQAPADTREALSHAPEAPVFTQVEQGRPADVEPAAPPTPPTPPTPPAPPAPISSVDVTDAGAPAAMEPTSDVAFASAYPSFVSLPDQAAPPVMPASPEAVTQPEVPLYLMPDEATQGFAPDAESYVPPTPDIAAPQVETYTPSWDAPTEMPAQAQGPSTFEEVAGLGALAGAGALAADAWAHHGEPAAEPMADEPVAADEPQTAPMPAVEPVAPLAPKMKRIRIKHRIVVDGQIVREEIVEREIPADADMAAAARQIQEELERGQGATPDEIARLANLSGGEEVEVRRRVEGLDQQ
jgi:TM2 domain-containing membrane protein YozV